MLKIYDGTPIKRSLNLRLMEDGSKIQLRLVDDDGFPLPRGKLLEIDTETGVISRCAHVDDTLGLKLNGYGELLIF